MGTEQMAVSKATTSMKTTGYRREDVTAVSSNTIASIVLQRAENTAVLTEHAQQVSPLLDQVEIFFGGGRIHKEGSHSETHRSRKRSDIHPTGVNQPVPPTATMYFQPAMATE